MAVKPRTWVSCNGAGRASSFLHSRPISRNASPRTPRPRSWPTSAASPPNPIRGATASPKRSPRRAGSTRKLKPDARSSNSSRARPAERIQETHMSFEGKIAVVTGGASGIGQATAEALAKEGATVIVADINVEGGQKVASAIHASGGKADFFKLDVTSDAAVNTFAQDVEAKYGPVDIIVNGAGWGATKPFWEGTNDFWDKLVNLNFVGPMKLVRALLPKMMERGSGRIVNIASDAG